MSTLYRDYRPQNFAEILGQNHIKITLQNEISAGKIAQAFLFCGPRAVGKTTLARVLAKAVNCLEHKAKDFEPCNQCASCEAITKGNSLDVVEIDAASNTGVDNVRENIITFSRLAPSVSKFKVFIIDEVHMLSISAFNALLKIIEEPPAHVIFILCTTEINKVPLTIVSRCERFDFKRISVSDIVKKLSFIAAAEKISVDREVLEAVARKSGGHLRDAESLLGQIFSLGDKKITLEQAELVMPHYNSNEAVDLLDFLSRKDAAKAVGLVNGLVDSGVNIKNFTGELINLLRKILLNKLSPELADNLGLDLGENLEMRLSQVANNLSQEQLLMITRRFLDVFNDYKSTFIPQLPLEMAMVELCLSSGTKSQPASISPTKPKTLTENKIDNKTDKLNKEISSASPVKSEENINRPAAPLNLSQSEIIKKWPEFLVKIKKYNHSLSFVLQNCQPQEIKDAQLGLVFKYKFHQDRVNNAAIKTIVEDTLADVYGSGLSLVSSVDENLDLVKEEPIEVPTPTEEPAAAISLNKESNKKSGGLINDILQTFGGEVIS